MDTIDRNLLRIRAAVEKSLIIHSKQAEDSSGSMGEHSRGIFFRTDAASNGAIERTDLIEQEKTRYGSEAMHGYDFPLDADQQSAKPSATEPLDALSIETDVWGSIKRRLGLGT